LREDIKELRKFGIILSIMLIIVRFMVMLWKGHAHTWPLYASPIIFTISVIAPIILKPIRAILMKIGSPIFKIIGCTILGLFFYVVIVPVGLFMKILGRDSLQRKFDRNAQTYWIKREYRLSEPKRIERQF